MSFPRSDHCNGKTFFNPDRTGVRNLWDVLRWQLTSRPAPWPERLPATPARPPAPPTAGVMATWIGHASFLLQTPHGNFLTDPVWSERASPVGWLGPKRRCPPGVAFADLPRIDAVLLSHDHYDHCDRATLRRLEEVHRPVFLAPLGHARLLASWGLTRAVDLDWWQTHRWKPEVEVTLLPARHWCRRTPWATNRRLWGGFGLRTPDAVVYFAGDTCFDPALYAEIARRIGPPDLALLPIGSYAPRWFMRTVHQDPAEAVQAHLLLGARRSAAMHWGTWRLTDEPWDEPPQKLAAARRAADVADGAFLVMQAGESVTVASPPGSS